MPRREAWHGQRSSTSEEAYLGRDRRGQAGDEVRHVKEAQGSRLDDALIGLEEADGRRGVGLVGAEVGVAGVAVHEREPAPVRWHRPCAHARARLELVQQRIGEGVGDREIGFEELDQQDEHTAGVEGLCDLYGQQASVQRLTGLLVVDGCFARRLTSIRQPSSPDASGRPDRQHTRSTRLRAQAQADSRSGLRDASRRRQLARLIVAVRVVEQIAWRAHGLELLLEFHRSVTNESERVSSAADADDYAATTDARTLRVQGRRRG